MRISIDTKGLDTAIARLRGLSEKKIKVATVAALNDAARAGYEEAGKEMARVFDKPTRWVLGGVRYVKARPDKLSASIDFDRWGNKAGVSVADVLRAEIEGGRRRYKRHEVALQRAGILPDGMYIVPGEAAQRDAYGNMKASQIVQIISWFRAFGEQGYKANMDTKGRARLGRDKVRTGQRGFQYFALQKPYGKLLPGIYQRVSLGNWGSAVKPVMLFVRSPVYRKRFDFYGVAEKAARAQFDRSFSFWLDKLLAERGL